MARSSKRVDANVRRSAPAFTPEDRENQMIALADSLAEKKLRDGTASNSLIEYYLKRGSTRERLEKEKLEREIELLTAKTDAIASAKEVEVLYKEALAAMRSYRGEDSDDEDY